MTADEFRSLALGLPDAVEASHHDHSDFRVGGKIFATIMRDGDKVKLTPAQQAELTAFEPQVFRARSREPGDCPPPPRLTPAAGTPRHPVMKNPGLRSIDG